MYILSVKGTSCIMSQRLMTAVCNAKYMWAKACKMDLQTCDQQTQISLHICTVCSEPSLVVSGIYNVSTSHAAYTLVGLHRCTGPSKRWHTAYF